MSEDAPAPVAFDGVILLKEFIRMSDGNQYNGIQGEVTIQSDQQLVGFRARSSDNWVATVEGHTERVTILGCQIRGAITNPAEHINVVEPLYWYKVR